MMKAMNTNTNTNNTRNFDKKNVIIIVLAALLLISIVISICSTVAHADHECPIPNTTENTVHVIEYVKVPVEIPVEVETIVEVEKVIEKPVEIEKIVEVPVEVVVEKVVEVEVPVEVEKIVEIEKPVEVIKEVEKVVEVEKIVEVPVEVIVEVPVIKEVIVEKVVEVIVEKPYPETEAPATVRYTTFDLNDGSSFTAYWNNEAVCDEIIYDILHYMIQPTFSGNGTTMTLNIAGNHVVFNANNIECNGVVVAVLEGCTVINGSVDVAQMVTQQ